MVRFLKAKAIIRKMRQEDLTIVSELAMLANPHAVKEKYSEHLLDELRENPDLSFVAVDDGKVVGYVQADVKGEIAILEDIVVEKSHQKKGIGRLLLSKELKTLKRKGVKVVFAEVHYKCSSAIPFYYKFDFRISGFSQDYFGIGHDAMILKKLI
jgi:predicted N-acetyltransferase YhbS